MPSSRKPGQISNGNSARVQYSLMIGSTSARRKPRTRCTRSRSAGSSSASIS